MTQQSDLMLGKGKTAKPVFRNGTVVLDNSTMGYWQDHGVDASDGVCYRYAMGYVRQYADGKVFDLENDIPADAGVGGSGTLAVYGTYTPNSSVAMNVRMMGGSTLDLSGVEGAWSVGLGGVRVMSFAADATVNVEFGNRELAAGDKVVAWDAVPAGVVFADVRKRWHLDVAQDGIYLRKNRGFMMLVW